MSEAPAEDPKEDDTGTEDVFEKLRSYKDIQTEIHELHEKINASYEREIDHLKGLVKQHEEEQERKNFLAQVKEFIPQISGISILIVAVFWCLGRRYHLALLRVLNINETVKKQPEGLCSTRKHHRSCHFEYSTSRYCPYL